MSNRTFSKEEKRSILKEASGKDVTATLEKHGIYPTTFCSWKQKYENMGLAGFERGMTSEYQKRIRALEKESRALRELVSQKELEGKPKDERRRNILQLTV